MTTTSRSKVLVSIGLVAFLSFSGISSIASSANASPLTVTKASEQSTMRVLELLNGKHRIRLDMADRFGKSRIAVRHVSSSDGEKIRKTLGVTKLKKKGKGFVTFSDPVSVGQKIHIFRGTKRIHTFTVFEIESKRAASSPAVSTPIFSSPGGSSGSGGGAPPALATFTATNTSGIITFGGTSTGDITISWAGNPGDSVATFTRASLTATADFSSTTVGRAASLNLSSADVLLTSAEDILNIDVSGDVSGDVGRVKLTNTTLEGSTLATLYSDIGGIIDAGLATSINGTATQVVFVIEKATILRASNFNSAIAGLEMTAAQANAIDAVNGTGITTGRIKDGSSKEELLSLTTLGAVNAYRIIISQNHGVTQADIDEIRTRTIGEVSLAPGVSL